MKKRVVDLAVDLPLEGTYSYILPEEMESSAATGMRLLVPFGRRKLTAYLLSSSLEECTEGLKTVEALLDKTPLFNKKMLELFRWVSGYYFHPLGEVIKSALPPGINSKSSRIIHFSGFNGQSLSGKELEIAEFIENKGSVRASELEKRFGATVNSCINRLASRNIVYAETRVQEGSVREKLARYVVYVQKSPDDIEGLGKRSREVLSCLSECGAMKLGEFINYAATSRDTLMKLVDAGFASIEERDEFRDPFLTPVKPVAAPELTKGQANVVNEIETAINKRDYSPFLLQGLTGSGKTEIYLRAIESSGGGALVLIPEISLTPQLTARFRERFGDRVAVLHSGLSAGERFDQWRKIKEGQLDIVIGARSAIFAPLPDLKVIIVDEEHEASYKQDEGFRYNARDVALVRGKMEKSLVILGSATPSLESLKNARDGKFRHLILPERIGGRPLPSIEVVDMRREKKDQWLSDSLKLAIKENLEAGNQTMLFLNRRGFSPYVFCQDCGHTFRCPNCSVTLTLHQKQGRMRCHYCDYQASSQALCPECSGDNVKGFGLGTERLEEELAVLFEGAKIARIDRDTTKGRGAMESRLAAFEKGDIDILVGTQMIAKGHHFPGVTLVGVLMADLSLNVPDFRSAERTFQLLTQVAGRAGRGENPGRVVVQTFMPDHYAILHGGEDDAETFYSKELDLRCALEYPPFVRLLNIRVDGNNEAEVSNTAKRLRLAGDRIIKKGNFPSLELLGPAPSPLVRVKRKYKWQLLVKCKDSNVLHRFGREMVLGFKKSPSSNKVRLIFDFDPSSLL